MCTYANCTFDIDFDGLPAGRCQRQSMAPGTPRPISVPSCSTRPLRSVVCSACLRHPTRLRITSYRVEASMDGKTWGKPVAEGAASGARTIITFAPIRAKFIRITQTATTENAPGWSISNLRVYQPGPGK